MGALVAQHGGVRDHQPVTLLFDAKDTEEEALIEILGRLLRSTQLHRRTRAERGDAVDHDVEAALVPADHLAFDVRLVGDRRLYDLGGHQRELFRRRLDELVDRLAGGAMALVARLAVALFTLRARPGLLGARCRGLGRWLAGYRIAGRRLGGPLRSLGTRCAGFGGGFDRLRFGGVRRGRSRGGVRGGRGGIDAGFRGVGRIGRDGAVLELGHAGLRIRVGAVPAKASEEARLARRIAQEARGAKRSRNAGVGNARTLDLRA